MLSVLVPGVPMAADQSISRLINLSNSRAASAGCIFQSQCPDAPLSGELWLVSVVSRPKLCWEEIGTSCRGKNLGLSAAQHYTQVKPGSHRILSAKRIHRYLIKCFLKCWNWKGLRLKNISVVWLALHLRHFLFQCISFEYIKCLEICNMCHMLSRQ